MSARDDLVASLKRFALGETVNPAMVAQSIEREALALWDDGVAAGVDMAVRVLELAAAGRPADTHALHGGAEAIRAAHRELIDKAAEDDRRFTG